MATPTPTFLSLTILALAACGGRTEVPCDSTSDSDDPTATDGSGSGGTEASSSSSSSSSGSGSSSSGTSAGSSGDTGGGEPDPCKDDLESVAATPGNGCCMYPMNLGIESRFTCVDRVDGDYTQGDCDEIQGVWFTGRCADRPGSGGSFDWTFNEMEWIGTSSLGCVDAVAIGDFIDVRAHSVGPESREDLKMLHGLDDWWPNPDTCMTDPDC